MKNKLIVLALILLLAALAVIVWQAPQCRPGQSGFAIGEVLRTGGCK